jgi:hypothetical protein
MENMKAVRVHNYGGPEVLRVEDAPSASWHSDIPLHRSRPLSSQRCGGSRRLVFRQTKPSTNLGNVLGNIVLLRTASKNATLDSSGNNEVIVTLDDNETDELECGMLIGSKGR